MAWSDGQALRVFLPALTDVFVGGQACACVELLGTVIRHLAGAEMCRQGLIGLVRGLLHGGIFSGTIQPCHVAVRPRMTPRGQPGLEALLTAHPLAEKTAGIGCAASVSTLAAVVGPHGVARVRHGSDEGTPAWRRHQRGGFGGPRGRRSLAGPGDGHDEPPLAVCGTPRGSRAREVTTGGGRQRLRRGCGALDLRQAAAVVQALPYRRCPLAISFAPYAARGKAWSGSS
jgi:hypothetical protein